MRFGVRARAQVLLAVAISSVLFGLRMFPNDPDWETNVAQWTTAICAGFG